MIGGRTRLPGHPGAACRGTCGDHHRRQVRRVDFAGKARALQEQDDAATGTLELHLFDERAELAFQRDFALLCGRGAVAQAGDLRFGSGQLS